MSADSLLLVLIVREAGLRSALVARLGMTGVDLLTVEDLHDPQIGRSRHERVVLIADDSTVTAESPARWHEVVLLVANDASAVKGATCIARADAATRIGDLIPGWRAAR